MKLILLFICTLGLVSELHAQETTDRKKWHLLLEPYLMGPHINGNVAVGTQPVSNINENPHDIFSHVRFAAMLYAEAYNNRWLISSDLTYMKLGADIPSNDPVLGGHAEMKQLGWELTALRRVRPWLGLGIAGQLNSINSSLDISTTSGAEAGSLTRTWVDPSFVAAIKMPLKHNLTIRVRGNIGGFDIGSKLFWQAQAYVDYRFTRLFQLSAGYRVIKIDYEKGSGSDYFLYNLCTFGPVIRFGFNF